MVFLMQKEYFGEGCIQNLDSIVSNESPNSIFLVTGGSAYESSGAKKCLDSVLKDYKVIHFSNYQVNPTIEDVKKGIKLFRANQCDLVIAIGGGSCIDIAKLINILSCHPEEPEKYVLKEKPLINTGKPLVAIPTTSGTGSESTHFAVCYIGKTKYSLAKDSILPNYAILDPQFTYNLPQYITASTTMDAFCQAVESFWSVNSTDESKEFSREAINLILKVTRLEQWGNQERAQIMRAANLAGKAINLAKTTACHAISYPITSYYKVSHGHAAALTLGQMFLFNSNVNLQDCSDYRGYGYVKQTMEKLMHILNVNTAEAANEKIQAILHGLQLETSLTKLGMGTKEDHDVIVSNGFNPDRVKNNPRRLSKEQLYEILEKLS
jgi:alcohol dehydrogenase